MNRGTLIALIVTGAAVLIAGAATGFCGLMMWGLALNGFMGQQRAVDTSLFTYIAFAVISALLALALSLVTVYYLAGKRAWNAAGSAALSIVVFAVTTGVLHTICVVISAVVADQMRTSR